MKEKVLSISLVLVSVMVVLAVAEIGLRLSGYRKAAETGPHFQRWAEPDARLGWRSRAGVWSVDCDNRPMTILRDGLRKTAWQGPSVTGRRVLLVGGSWFQGYGLRDEQTCASLLQRRFRSSLLLNYGTPGYGTYQSLLLMEELFGDAGTEKPDVTIYGFCEHHQQRNVASYDWVRALVTYSGVHFIPPHILSSRQGVWEEFPP